MQVAAVVVLAVAVVVGGYLISRYITQKRRVRDEPELRERAGAVTHDHEGRHTHEDLPPLEASVAGLRLGIVQGFPLDALDDRVSAAFARGLDALGKAGARLAPETLPLDEMVRVNAKGGIVPAEAYAVHRRRLASHGDAVDPNVRLRIERAKSISAADYVEMLHARAALVRKMDARLDALDAAVLPTVPIVAPKLSDVATPEAFGRNNAMSLRNTSVANFFDLCAISLPLPAEGGLPVGLMLMARNGADRRLFAIAAAVERLLR